MADQPVNSAQDFQNAEGHLALGESLQLEYLREGKNRTVSLVIQEVPVLKGGDLDRRLDGARFVELGANYKQQSRSGVLLDELDPRSRLAREGLAEGDVITGVNRQRVRNLADFRELVESSRSSILLQIRRNGRVYLARID
jgi:S1-C subfamily serine protease